MTTMSEKLSDQLTRQSKRVSQSVFDGSRLRVVLLVDAGHKWMRRRFA